MTEEDLKKAAKLRKKNRIKAKIIQESELSQYENNGEGWIKSTGKCKTGFVRIEKRKSPDKLFEDEIWLLFYKMGFSEMNGTSSGFRIQRYNSGVTKQIDVFARDDHTICIIECKSAKAEHTSSARTDVRHAINEIKTMRQHIEASIFSHYKNEGDMNRFCVIWILALKNIDLCETDKERLKDSGIVIFNDDSLGYYKKLVDQFGVSAKYILLGDLLPNKEIAELTGGPVPAIQGMMGGKKFFAFLIEPDRLLKISYLAHRAKYDPDSYQRMAQKTRLNRIAKYIQEKPGGIFPTSIVININSDSKSFKFEPFKGMKDENAVVGKLYLPTRYHSAWIIDGQHRLFAYSGLEEAHTATLPVIAFVDLEPTYQAKLFVDINGEQKSVPKNILASLYATLHCGSEQGKERLMSFCSQIALYLNQSETSIFYHQIDDGGGETSKNITLANITDELILTGLIGTVPKTRKTELIPGLLYGRDFDETMEVINQYYMLYLNDERLKRQWNLGRGDGGFINSNTGIRVTLRLLGYMCTYEKLQQYDPPKKIFEKLEPLVAIIIETLAVLSPRDLNNLRKKSGKGGISDVTAFFVSKINEKYPDFELDIAKGYHEKNSVDRELVIQA